MRNKSLAVKSPGAVTLQDLDQYQAAEDQAIATLATSNATLETNELNLSFTKVTSAIDGRISRYNLTIGNLVQQDVTLLTTIVSVDPIYAYVDVDEHTVLHVKELIGQGKAKSAREVDLHVKLGLAHEQGFPREGTVNFVDNQVNPKTAWPPLQDFGAVFPNRDEFLAHRDCSPERAFPSANLTRPCWSQIARSTPIRVRRSCTSLTRTTRSIPGLSC